MARGVLIVFTNPVNTESEQAFNDWYDNHHMPDVLAIPGFVSARRFRLADVNGAREIVEQEAGYRYAAVYELEAGDLQEPMDALKKAASHPAWVTSDALEMAPRPTSFVFEQL